MFGYSPQETDEENLAFELDEFFSDDGQHRVIWGGDGPYPIWYCADHKQAYYSYCINGQYLAEKAYGAESQITESQ